MPGSKESLHPHKVVGKFVHFVSVPGEGKKESVDNVRDLVRTCMERWRIGEVSLTELWGVTSVASSCGGSKRYLVGCLGGFGDCSAILPLQDEFDVRRERGRGILIRWKGWRDSVVEPKEDWGRMEVETTELAGDW